MRDYVLVVFKKEDPSLGGVWFSEQMGFPIVLFFLQVMHDKNLANI